MLNKNLLLKKKNKFVIYSALLIFKSCIKASFRKKIKEPQIYETYMKNIEWETKFLQEGGYRCKTTRNARNAGNICRIFLEQKPSFSR